MGLDGRQERPVPLVRGDAGVMRRPALQEGLHPLCQACPFTAFVMSPPCRDGALAVPRPLP